VAGSAALWLLALIRLDPHRGAKGTGRRVAGFFLLGMLSVVPTFFLYGLYHFALPLRYDGLWDDFVYHVGGVGPIEELSKVLVFTILVTRFRSLREPADGIYQAAAVGLGFAIVENVSYGLDYGPAVALARAFVTPLAHMTYAAIWGFVYASRRWGRTRFAMRDRFAVAAAVLPAAFIHGLSNFLGNFGLTILVFDFLCAGAALLVLRRLRSGSPFASRDLGRSTEALASIGASLRHDPANPYLHLRAAHFRMRVGDADQAVRHIDRYLAARPGDPYGLGLKGAARVLSGSMDDGEALMMQAKAAMKTDAWRKLNRTVRRLIAPGRGRPPGGYGEFLLGSWLDSPVAARERFDPRRIPPRLVGPAAPDRQDSAHTPPVDGHREDAELVAEQALVAAGCAVPRTQVDAARAAAEGRAVAEGLAE
jgi:RsiW-degrading membrane proteinase PrsW (M82 family)